MLTSWELALRAERKSKATVVAYTSSVRQFAEWEGDVDVTAVSREDVRGWLVHLEDEGNSPATLRTRYGGLRRFFGWLVDDGELEHSPMDRIEAPVAKPPPIRVLTEAEAKRLVNIPGRDFNGRRDEAMLRLFLDTGMRLGAMLGLKVSDIDLTDRVAYVNTKCDKYRACPFGFATAKTLDTYLRARERHEKAHLPDLWIGQRGGVRRTGAQRIVRTRGEDTGIEGLHPHALRHTFADHWLANDGQEGDLMELAGWSSRQMLDRYAARNRANRARSAHDRLALGDRL